MKKSFKTYKNANLFLPILLAILAFIAGVVVTHYVYRSTLLIPINYGEKYSQIYREKSINDSYWEAYVDLVNGFSFRYPQRSRINFPTYTLSTEYIDKEILSLQMETSRGVLYIRQLDGKDIDSIVKKYKLHKWQELLEVEYKTEKIGDKDVLTAETVITEDKQDIYVPYKGGQTHPFGEEEIGDIIKAYFLANNNNIFIFEFTGKYLPISKDYLPIMESFEFLY